GSPSTWMTSLPFAYTSWAQPTAQYGQMLVPTRSASSRRGRVWREPSDSAASLIGSAPRSCRGIDQSRSRLPRPPSSWPLPDVIAALHWECLGGVTLDGRDAGERGGETRSPASQEEGCAAGGDGVRDARRGARLAVVLDDDGRSGLAPAVHGVDVARRIV